MAKTVGVPATKRQWAFTAPGASYPGYLNVSERDDGAFSVTVRSPAKQDGSCGEVSVITMDGADFMLWLGEINDGLIQ